MSCANQNASKKHFKRFPNINFKILGKTNLSVSDIGFGTYRIDQDNEEHQLALETALSHGINIIDTSSNYTNGDAEKLIGHVLNDFIYKQQCSREEIVLVSKAGYIQANLWNYLNDNPNEKFSETVDIDYGLSHCIHPDFLKHQISQSLDRLNVATIDVFLLHNPEYFLIHAQSQKIPIKEAQEIFIQRILKAFDYLEEEIKDGRICYYGVSSNTFAYPDQHPHKTNLKHLISSKYPNFSVIQCPLNIFETETLINPEQNQESCIHIAQKNNLGILTNRSLNAYHKQQLYCLQEMKQVKTSPKNVSENIKNIIQLEQSLANQLKRNDQKENQSKEPLSLNIGNNIKHYYKNLKGLEESKQLFSHIILPQLEHQIQILLKQFDINQNHQNLIESYISHINTCAKAMIDEKRESRYLEITDIKKTLQNIIPNSNHLNISQIAMGCVRSCTEVSSTLVGLRKQSYVLDALSSNQSIPIKNVNRIWKKLCQTFQT